MRSASVGPLIVGLGLAIAVITSMLILSVGLSLLLYLINRFSS
jgi:hypothetical protein